MIIHFSIGDFEKQLIWLFNDEMLHLIAYCLLSMLIYLGLGGHLLSRIVLSYFVVSGLGAIDELIQNFFPNRDPSFDDWLVDCLVCITTVGFMAMVQSFLPQKENDELESDID
jgi:VanZ family protein